MTALQVSAQKQLRQLVEQIERLEEEAILAVYMHALGMEGTPLDDYAKAEEAKGESVARVA